MTTTKPSVRIFKFSLGSSHIGTLQCEIKENVYDGTIIDSYDNTKPAYDLEYSANWVISKLRSMDHAAIFSASSDTLSDIIDEIGRRYDWDAQELFY